MSQESMPEPTTTKPQSNPDHSKGPAKDDDIPKSMVEDVPREQILIRAFNKHLDGAEPAQGEDTKTAAQGEEEGGKLNKKLEKLKKNWKQLGSDDQQTVKTDEENLRKEGKKIVELVTKLGTRERLAEANDLSEAKSVEEAVSRALSSGAADGITEIVKQAKGVITSDSAKRTLKAKSAQLLVATDRALSDGAAVDKLGNLTNKGIDHISTLAEEGKIKEKSDVVLKKASKILDEIAEGKGLSAEELKKWTSFISKSDSDKKEALASDPNLAAMLEKANSLLKHDATVNFLKDKKGGISDGASMIMDKAQQLLANKKSQATVKKWAASGLNLLRTATAERVWRINDGFKFHVRSEPTVSGKKKNGIVLRSGDAFTVSEVRKDESGQTFLKLADGRGWVFTDHPKEGDNRKLVSEVKMVASPDCKDKDGNAVVSAQKNIAHRGKQLLDITGKRYLGKSADDILSHGSRIVKNKRARDAFLREIKDASVEFMLSYLPTMQIGPIEGEKENTQYKLWDIDLSGFKILSEHVSVQFDDKKMQLQVIATQLSCKMKKLGWQYKQLKFPYLSGKGRADAVTTNAKFLFVVAIEFITKEEAARRKVEMELREKKRKEEKLKRQPPKGFKTAGRTIKMVPEAKDEDVSKSSSAEQASAESNGDHQQETDKEQEGKKEDLILQVTLKEKKMVMRDLKLEFDTGGGMSTWVYNKGASIFKESIRSYVEKHLNKSLDSYSSLILDLCNKYAQQYYLMLYNILIAAKKGAKKSKLSSKLKPNEAGDTDVKDAEEVKEKDAEDMKEKDAEDVKDAEDGGKEPLPVATNSS
uniref:Uncharacterized protein n=2 Tax=Lotharella globosa TaxID=91324 RepID=A0A7S3YYC1_9EUKA|mmetsp:Transcript_12696/g.25917  ORF Transcript_12696/g.25917 Transcript_12696/m.25917 type:complete len:817 (+) Transcript_12696:31-2481(+)